MGSMANALGRLDDEKLEDISKEDGARWLHEEVVNWFFVYMKQFTSSVSTRSILVIIKILKIT